MTLGDIIQEAIKRDMASEKKVNQLLYSETVIGGKFQIKFMSGNHAEASIEVSVPYTGKQEEENYARLYFLSMAFNAAILGLKRFKHKKNKK